MSLYFLACPRNVLLDCFLLLGSITPIIIGDVLTSVTIITQYVLFVCFLRLKNISTIIIRDVFTSSSLVSRCIPPWDPWHPHPIHRRTWRRQVCDGMIENSYKDVRQDTTRRERKGAALTSYNQPSFYSAYP